MLRIILHSVVPNLKAKWYRSGKEMFDKAMKTERQTNHLELSSWLFSPFQLTAPPVNDPDVLIYYTTMMTDWLNDKDLLCDELVTLLNCVNSIYSSFTRKANKYWQVKKERKKEREKERKRKEFTKNKGKKNHINHTKMKNNNKTICTSNSFERKIILITLKEKEKQ